MADKNSKYSPAKGGQPDGGFRQFLWNGDTGEFLGRTGTSWAKIIVFYIIFFAGLAAFFGLMLYVFYLTLDVNRPKWTEAQSLIGTNPGVGFRPMPDQDKNVESTLIWFKRENEDDWKFWSEQLTEHLNKIENPNQPTSSDLQTCSLSNVRDEKEKNTKACKVDVTKLGACNKNNHFGYNRGEPCILIKLNKIFGWEPVGFGNPWDWETNTKNEGSPTMAILKESLAKKVEGGMPTELQTYIEKEAAKLGESTPEFKNFVNTVWISCEGENPADKENIGPVNYFPMPGIPSYYFPYAKQRGYQSPFVMLQLNKPLSGVLINIECKAWAHNIIPDRQTRVGSVHLEIMVD